MWRLFRPAAGAPFSSSYHTKLQLDSGSCHRKATLLSPAARIPDHDRQLVHLSSQCAGGIGWGKPRRLSAANPTPHGQRGFRMADVPTSQDTLGFYLCLYLSPLKLFNLKKNWKLCNKSRQGVSRLLLSTAREKMFQALWAMRFLLKQLTFAVERESCHRW